MPAAADADLALSALTSSSCAVLRLVVATVDAAAVLLVLSRNLGLKARNPRSPTTAIYPTTKSGAIPRLLFFIGRRGHWRFGGGLFIDPLRELLRGCPSLVMDSRGNMSLFTAIVDYLEELFWVWVHRVKRLKDRRACR